MNQSSTTIVAAPPRALPAELVVRVTEEDGQLGRRRNPHWCRFARAIRRALVLLGFQPISVDVGSTHGGYSTVWIDLGYGTPTMYEFDPGTQITEYDCGSNPPPCTVTLVAS